MALIREDESAREIADAMLDTPTHFTPHFQHGPADGHYCVAIQPEMVPAINSKTATLTSVWHLFWNQIKK